MTRWNRPYLFLSIALVAFGAVDLRAQLNRGIIEGIVTDPQGAVIPGVAIKVTSVDRNESLPARTNSAGLYRVVDLISGKYRAHFEASGFAAMEVIDIEVPAGEVIRVDAKLQIGATRQEVQVTAAAPLLETGPTNASSTLETRTISEIPLAGRDLQQLVFLVPGVASVGGPPGSNFGFNSQYGTFPDPTHILGTDVAVSGGQAGANAWYLDGNLNLSGVSENVVVNPSPDAVGEFQAITNSLSAEYGRTGGGVFNVVLKSGTNALHGNIYEYIRNDATNARNPFTSIDSQGHIIKSRQLRFNNFGGTLGGPVVLPHLYDGKDKTFFFFSWDASILHLLGNQPYTVPTALMRQGDFSESPNTALYGIYDPFTSIGPASDGTFARSAFGTPLVPNGCTGQIVGPAGNTTVLNPTSSTCQFSTSLPSSRLDPTAMYFMKSFPLPNYNNPLTQQCPKDGNGFSICGNFLGAVGSSLHNHNISLKVDHQWSDKSRYFGEWLFNPGKYNNYRLPWTGPTAQFSGWGASSFGYGADHPVDFANQIISFGNTYSIRPTLINEFRVSFSRQFMTTTPSHPFPDSLTSQKQTEQVLAPLHIYSNLASPVPDWYMGEPGGSIHFGPNGYDNQITGGEAYTLLDNVTKVAGKHTLKFGMTYRLDHFFWEGEFPTSLNFSGALTSNPITGLGGEGGLDQFMLGAVGPNYGYGYSISFGHLDSPYLRWGYWGTYFQDDFHVTPRLTLNLGLRYDWFEWFRSRYIAGDTNFCFGCPDPATGFIGKVVRMKGHNIWPTDPKDIGPRVNFAWSPFANQKTVIRGGYDVIYSNIHSILAGPDASLTETGHELVPYIPYSWTPNTCANYSGQCVIFPLSSTSVNELSVTVPAFNPGVVPGNDPNNPLYLHYPEFFGANKDPIVQQWGLEVQRELPGQASLTVGYIGTHGTHLAGVLYDGFSHVPTQEILQYRLQLNNPTPIASYYSGLQLSKLEKAYGTTSLPLGNLLVHNPLYIPYGTENFNGTTIYHALNVRFQKRYSQGLNFIASYTFSKKIDNAEIGQATDESFTPFGLGPAGRVGVLGWQGGHGRWLFRDPDNRRIDRSIAADDIPQMLNLAATYELPFGAGRHFLNRKGVVNQTLGGWRLTANLNAQSGIPLLITCPGDAFVSLAAGFGQDWYDGRCNLIGNPRFSSRPRAARIADWINAAAFEPSFGSDQTFWANYNPQDPRAYTIGNADVFIPGLRSPGFWNIDTSLGKQFHVTENKYFEFRWEAFNALNHQNLGYPNTGYCLPPTAAGTTDLVHQAGCSFGRITNIQTDPRSMQFALKFFW